MNDGGFKYLLNVAQNVQNLQLGQFYLVDRVLGEVLYLAVEAQLLLLQVKIEVVIDFLGVEAQVLYDVIRVHLVPLTLTFSLTSSLKLPENPFDPSP